MNKPTILTVPHAVAHDSLMKKAADALSAGAVLILPTDTVYGVGALPQCTQAMDKIYAIKQRPRSKPLPRLISTSWYKKHLRDLLPAAARRCADRYWPGALTIICEVDGTSIGYRVPDHPATLALLDTVDQPLAVTSANRSGDPEALTAQEAMQALPECDMVLDAGAAPGGQASTVIRFSESGFDVLRPGSVSKESVEDTVKP